MARRCWRVSESNGCCCLFLSFFFFFKFSLVSCPLQSHAGPPRHPAAPALQPERLQPITRGHSRAGFKADKCAGKHSGNAGNHIKFYYRHAVTASLFMEDGEADLPRQSQTHLIDLALYPFILFKGTKRREQMQTVRSLCRVSFSSCFLYCPELFTNTSSVQRRLLSCLLKACW